MIVVPVSELDEPAAVAERIRSEVSAIPHQTFLQFRMPVSNVVEEYEREEEDRDAARWLYGG